MAAYRVGDQTCRTENDQKVAAHPFEACSGEPKRDLKGGACSLHLESGSCCFFPSPPQCPSCCRCPCSYSPYPPQPSSPICDFSSAPQCPRPVESCLPGLHQTYRDFYPDCTETHLPSSSQNFVEHDDLYLPPSRPSSAASNYCNLPTSSRSGSPPSESPRLKCHCEAAQFCHPSYQSFFLASSDSPRHYSSRCEWTQMSHEGSQSKRSSPVQQCSQVKNISCQCSPRIDSHSMAKSFYAQQSVASSPISPSTHEYGSRPRRPSPSSPTCYHSGTRFGYDEFEESYTRRGSVNHDSSASIRRVLRPESPLDLARSSRRLECTCQSRDHAGEKSFYNQMRFPTHDGSRSQSPAQSSIFTVPHGTKEADSTITTFLNEVKRILTSDAPPRLSTPTVRNQQEYYSSVRSTLRPGFSSKEMHSYPGRSEEKDRHTMFSTERIPDWQDENVPATEYSSKVRSTLKLAVPRNEFSSNASAHKKPETSSRDNFPFSGRIADDWEIHSNGRRVDQKRAEWEVATEPSVSEYPSRARTTERKQWEFPSSLDWEYPMKAADRRQEYSTCVRTIERGSSPIVVTPIVNDDSTKAEIHSSTPRRPTRAPNAGNPEASRERTRLDGVPEAAEISPAQTFDSDVSPTSESGECDRYAVVPESDPAKRTRLHDRECTWSRRQQQQQQQQQQQPNRDVTHRCCCGNCKSTYSRSHFTTKCPFCANEHSCCCGLCSCPFPSCTSKSSIRDSTETSNYTSTTSSPRHETRAFHHNGFRNNRLGYAAQSKSKSPVRTYLAGLDRSRGRRSKSATGECKLPERRIASKFEQGPRALLESFHNYLKSQSLRGKGGSGSQQHQHRRCSEVRSAHWNRLSADRNCSQRAHRVRSTTRNGWNSRPQQQQAPWGTHPIVMSAGPPQVEYRLPYSGSHRGCCCQRCVNGKL